MARPQSWHGTRYVQGVLSDSRHKVTPIQVYYWSDQIGLKPRNKGRQQGRHREYSSRDIFALLLFKRLFQELGLGLPVAAEVTRFAYKTRVGLDDVVGVTSLEIVTMPVDKNMDRLVGDIIGKLGGAYEGTYVVRTEVGQNEGLAAAGRVVVRFDDLARTAFSG